MTPDEKKKIQNDISQLDTGSRKELFNKFVEHGGQVVEDKKQKSNIKNFNREKQKEFSKLQEKKREEIKKKYGSSEIHAKKDTENKKEKSVKKDSDYEGSGKIGLYFTSVFSKIRTLTGGYLTPSFIKLLKVNSQNSFLDLNLVVTTVMHSRSMLHEGLKKELIIKFPLYYELLLRLDKMHSDKEMSELHKKLNSKNDRNVKFSDVKDEIKAIFRKLYILQPYKSDCYDAIGTAFGLMTKFENISRGAVSEHVSRARSSINFLFGTFFNKIFTAFLNSIKSNIPLNAPVIPKMLNLQEEDYVGFIVNKIKEELKKRQENKEEEKKEEQPVEEEKKEEMENFPSEAREGAQIINEIKYSTDRFSKDDPRSCFDSQDKIFHVYTILEEFEKQFSFILTSNKIRYLVDYQHGGRFDPKKELNELYLQVTPIHDSLREYLMIIKEANEIENKPGVPIMQKHNQLHNLSIRQSKVNMNIRIKLLDVIKKMEVAFDTINAKVDLVIQNADEVLNFDDSIEGKKRLQRKNPVECIRITRSFIKALSHELQRGKLGGAGIRIS